MRIRHYARKPEARYAGVFSLLLTRIASNAREFWFTTNAHAHRLRGLEKTTDAESGYSEEVGIIVM